MQISFLIDNMFIAAKQERQQHQRSKRQRYAEDEKESLQQMVCKSLTCSKDIFVFLQIWKRVENDGELVESIKEANDQWMMDVHENKWKPRKGYACD